MSFMEKLLPAKVDNHYRGNIVALYALPVIAVVLLARSLIHYLKDDSGVNSIASLIRFSGDPDPNQLIYLYSSLWGSQQIITVVVIALVLFRYRSLISVIYLLLMLEVCLRLGASVIHPLTEAYYQHRPPGGLANIPMLIGFGFLFLLSLWHEPPRQANPPG